MVHIHDCLPSLKRRIDTLADKTRLQLASFGEPLPVDTSKARLLYTGNGLKYTYVIRRFSVSGHMFTRETCL